MSSFLIAGGIVLLVIVLAVRAFGKPGSGRTFRGGPGAGATGTVYDMLNEDKRRAIEIIVAGRAEMTDPETADDIPRNDGNDRPARRSPQGEGGASGVAGIRDGKPPK
jgi:hypothetical protein